jgi:cytochrome c peroxidase
VLRCSGGDAVHARAGGSAILRTRQFAQIDSADTAGSAQSRRAGLTPRRPIGYLGSTGYSRPIVVCRPRRAAAAAGEVDMPRIRSTARHAAALIAGACLLAGASCGLFPAPGLMPTPSPLDALLRLLLAANGARAVEAPVADAAKVELGRALYFDKLLSGNRNISCATCHHPLLGTGDGLSLSIGAGGSGLGPARTAPVAGGHPVFIPRNAPDVFNREGFDVMFWDGRVRKNEDGSLTTPAGADLLPGLDSALAAQAMFPVTSDAEMRGLPGENELADIPDGQIRAIWAGLMARVLAIAEYRDLFAAAYPGVPADQLTFAHAANAIAAFEVADCTLTDSPYDRYLRGDDSALSAAQKRGAMMFYGAAGCAHCHAGPLMSDQQFHNIGVPALGPGKGDGPGGTADFGRERVTGDAADRYRFRTPPLRNVAATGPWLHNGAYTDLHSVVRHHLDAVRAAGAYDPAQLDPRLQPLVHGDQTSAIVAVVDPDLPGAILGEREIDDIVAFLESLTAPSLLGMAEASMPARVPSGLPLGD